MDDSKEPPQIEVADSLPDELTNDGVFQVVLDGYEAVYEALADGQLFNRIWRANAYRDDFPVEFAHIGFLTLSEAERMVDYLGVMPDAMLVDLACGAGGPGLWAAQHTGANLIGIDPAASGVEAARTRARRTGLAPRSRFELGTLERTGLPDGAADGVMCVEAFQYAPNKRAALAELFRVLRPAGRLVFICFEVDPAKAARLPVLGVDPIADYRPLMEDAGFEVVAYEETPGWEDRVYGVFNALVAEGDRLADGIGEVAAGAVLAEAMITVEVKPYPRRILAVGQKPMAGARSPMQGRTR